MQKRLHLLMALLAFMVTTAMAQITTSGLSGSVTASGEDVIGATIEAVHVPSGTRYKAVTNIDGMFIFVTLLDQFQIQSIRNFRKFF